FSINDISKRTQIANTMEGLVDSALVTTPRAGGGKFRIATVTAFFLRDLQPPAQVVQAINNKIAQEQQIETERHRVEVARLQTEQDETTIVKLTERIIAEAAAHGRVVLVGRGAQALLAQRPDALHVYVVASKPWRVRLAVERLGVDPANAEKVVDDTDRRRDQ